MLFYLETVVAQSLKAFCRFCFFSSATKWKDCAIVPSGHWALNTMTTNCDPMRCSHADHTCCLDDESRCHARTGPGHMTNHGIFAYKTLLSVVLYFNVFGLRSPGASRRKRSKYLQTHTQVVLFAVILERIESPTLESHESHESLECLLCLVCQVCQCLG